MFQSALAVAGLLDDPDVVALLAKIRRKPR
jgi:hypothetical protein